MGEEAPPPVPKPRARGLQQADGKPTKREKAEKKLGKAAGRPSNNVLSPEVLPFEATLAYVFRGSGGKLTAINAARLLTSTNVKFERFIHAWDSASETDKNSLTLESLCSAADITADEFLGSVVPALWRRNTDLGRVISAASHPAVVDATIRSALTSGSFGIGDRRILLEHEGFIPTKQGMSINVDASHKTLQVDSKGKPQAEDLSGPGLPAFEEDMAFISETLSNPPNLLSGSLRLLPQPTEGQSVRPPKTEEEEILEGDDVLQE